jgi:hypothetical protein
VFVAPALLIKGQATTGERGDTTPVVAWRRGKGGFPGEIVEATSSVSTVESGDERLAKRGQRRGDVEMNIQFRARTAPSTISEHAGRTWRTRRCGSTVVSRVMRATRRAI